MTFYDRLQAAIACTNAPYEAPASGQFDKSRYHPLDVLPPKLQGLWRLISELRDEIEEIRNSIRRRELHCAPDEDVRNDHDHTEAIVYHELTSVPRNRQLLDRKNRITMIFIDAAEEIFIDEPDLRKAISYNWWRIDESWQIWLPNLS